MEILVYEASSAALPVNASGMKDEYENLKAMEGVTYGISGKGYYVMSGYSSSDEIYYYCADYDGDFYKRVGFRYPAEKAEAVLLVFLKDHDAGTSSVNFQKDRR